MSCRRRRGYRRFSTSAYRLLGDFEVAINGGVWVATGVNLGGGKRFESINESHFERIAKKMEAPTKFVLDAVKETVATAQKEWPAIIREIGFPENMRDRLFSYWSGLSDLLRIRQ